MGAASDQNLYDPVKYSSLHAFADDLIDLIGEMNLISPVFIGHSVSGMIGCIASTKRPELFKKLILLCSSPRFLNSEDYKGGFESCELEQIFSIALSFAKTVFNNDHRDVLEKVQVPCTIIQTSNDIAVPVDVAYFMQKKIEAKSTVEIIDTCGHFPQLTDHKVLIDVLTKSLSSNLN
ncbi:hypothetical protein L1049_018375 [Liquidambar formosana]|uniref:Uncharacterized protein n=1 Tax=Liquidambar formosana TaxID=63359 RepID=A0AAP0WN03_LIQFO